MDNKFYIDDFEHYLKEKADEFKMYPSKRVWNSIYNDMHPGSRWPSISMCIVLIGTLFLVGFLNTNTTSKSSSSSLSNQANSSIPVSYTFADLGNTHTTADTKNILPLKQTSASSKTIIAGIKNGSALISDPKQANKNTVSIIASANNNISGKQQLSISKKELNADVVTIFPVTTTEAANTGAVEKTEGRIISGDANYPIAANYETIVIEKNNHYKIIADKSLPDLQVTIAPVNNTLAINESRTANKNNQLSEADKFWIENYALYNRPAPKKWKGKLSWQTYFTPSVVYRSLENNAANKTVALTGIQNNSDINKSITHTPSFGLEFGTGLQYDISKRIKIKTGLQLNFTRYNAHAFDNGHPIATSLTMLTNNGDAAYEVSRISPYNSTFGITPVKLHNQTYQVSIPMGADYKIATIDNLEWYAGATIQPTFVLGSRSYLISTDRRNYVKEGGMLNRFNLNAGFETFVSYKTKGGVTWQIGPQFRRQIFSTNSKIYSIEEKLSNYGLKIGITKKL